MLLLLLKRFVVTLVVFILLVIGIPITLMWLHGELSSQKATGLGAVMSPDALMGGVIALIASAAVSILLVRG